MIGMSYTYEIDVQAMFDDRTDQFEKFGIPLGDIEKVRAAITDSGPTRPVVGATNGRNWPPRMSGLSGSIDAAVELGGPVADSFQQEHISRLPYGMHDILGNAMHWANPHPG